ncbi:MAG: translation elongation factor Ts [Chitinophagales bacterium]|nr:translation elongation factor Ts [Chitinophagales bacterium]MDW8427187.1 translation elongation factor Ts [Chitinophagales bacterium]
MSEIKAADVNRLRQLTGAGLMDCKKALAETGGNLEAAIDYLRKKGAKVSALRAGKETKEGVVVAQTNADATHGVIFSLNCETDFVAKNDEFNDFARQVSEVALQQDIKELSALLAARLGEVSISDRLAELVGKIGEKIELRSFYACEGPCVVPYIHSNKKLGVLVVLNKLRTEAIEQVGREIAMQVAAMNPVAVDQKGVPQALIDRELDIAREKARAEGKAEHLIDKIAAGALNKFFKENTLLSQEFVKDPKKTVAEVLRSVDKELTVLSFIRVTTQEG